MSTVLSLPTEILARTERADLVVSERDAQEVTSDLVHEVEQVRDRNSHFRDTSLEDLSTLSEAVDLEDLSAPLGGIDSTDLTSPLGDIDPEDFRSPLADLDLEDPSAPLGGIDSTDLTSPLGDIDPEDFRSPLADLDPEDLSTPFGGVDPTDLTSPLGDIDNDDFTNPLGGVDPEKLTNPQGGIDVQNLIQDFVNRTDLNQLTSPLGGVDPQEFTTPLGGIDPEELGSSLGGIDPTDLTSPLGDIDNDDFKSPLADFDPEDLSTPFGGVDPTDLTSPLGGIDNDDFTNPLGGIDPHNLATGLFVGSKLADLSKDPLRDVGHETLSGFGDGAKLATELAYSDLSAKIDAGGEGNVSHATVSETEKALYRQVLSLPEEAQTRILRYSDTIKQIIITVVVGLLLSPDLQEIRRNSRKTKNMVAEQRKSLEKIRQNQRELKEVVQKKEDYVVDAKMAGLWSRPDSNAVITDTLHFNNTVRRVDEAGNWTKIEYENQVEGEIRKGWVRARFLREIK